MALCAAGKAGILPGSDLSFKKNLEFYPDTPVTNSDDFSGCHNRFPGAGKDERHGYFLSGEQGPAGLDKNPAGAYILNKCFEVAIHGAANGNDRLDFVECFPCIPSSFKILLRCNLGGIISHIKSPPVDRQKSTGSPITRRAGGLDFSAIGGKRQRRASALIGAGVTGCKAPGLKTPNKTK
jgi:hypothetical protein